MARGRREYEVQQHRLRGLILAAVLAICAAIPRVKDPSQASRSSAISPRSC